MHDVGAWMMHFQVFNDMPKRDGFTWTTHIAQFSQTGQGNEDFRFFKSMEHEGVKPDRVTYISVLNACVKAIPS